MDKNTEVMYFMYRDDGSKFVWYGRTGCDPDNVKSKGMLTVIPADSVSGTADVKNYIDGKEPYSINTDFIIKAYKVKP